MNICLRPVVEIVVNILTKFVNNLLTIFLNRTFVKGLTYSKKNLTFFKISVIIYIESKERKNKKLFKST